MATFNITINDPLYLVGIEEARIRYNNSLVVNENEILEDHPDYKATLNDYVNFVLIKAAESYSKQFGFTDDAITEMETKLSYIKKKVGR